MSNILYDLQLSVLTSMNNGDFIMSTDSNVNVACFILKNLAKKRPKDTFYLLVPHARQIASLKSNVGMSIKSVLTDDLPDNVKFLTYEYYGNPFVDRITFNTVDLEEATNGIHFDCILTNDPSKVLQYKTFFYYKQKEFVSIISRNHWVTGQMDRKVPAEIDFVTRQIEGAIYGDYMTFNSMFAIDQFLYNAKEHFNEETINKFRTKLISMEMVDMTKVDAYKIERDHYRESSDAKFTFFWGHRLSYYTGWKEMFDVMLQLWYKRQDFQLIVPDIGNKTTQEQLHKDYPFITPIDKNTWNHQEYLKSCWKFDVCLGNHQIPATWGGLSITEPMSAGVIPLMPKEYAYKEMFYDDDRCFFKDEKDLLKKLEYLIDTKPLERKVLSDKARQYCKEELDAESFIEALNGLIIRSTSEI